MPPEDLSYKILKLIESQPELTQRELAAQLGISLGKANYCLRELIGKGWIKANNFKNSRNKLAYIYILTPQGITSKMQLTRRFLKLKELEYEKLKLEISRLTEELESQANLDK